MKLHTKGKYLSKKQLEAFQQLWNHSPILTNSIKQKVIKSPVFAPKFEASEGRIIDFYNNDIFKKILSHIRQDLDGYTVPLFTYNLKERKYTFVTNSHKFLREGVIRNLKFAKTLARFDPVTADKIQNIIDTL